MVPKLHPTPWGIWKNGKPTIPYSQSLRTWVSLGSVSAFSLWENPSDVSWICWTWSTWLNVMTFLLSVSLNRIKKSTVLHLCIRCCFESIFSLHCFPCWINISFIESGLSHYVLLHPQCHMQLDDNRVTFNTSLPSERMAKWRDRPFTVRGLFP